MWNIHQVWNFFWPIIFFLQKLGKIFLKNKEKSEFCEFFKPLRCISKCWVHLQKQDTYSGTRNFYSCVLDTKKYEKFISFCLCNIFTFFCVAVNRHLLWDRGNILVPREVMKNLYYYHNKSHMWCAKILVKS